MKLARGALSLALLLAGCGSPATHYFTLSAVSPESSPRAMACPGPPIAVQHVLLPAMLDRQSMVLAAGPNELKISSQNRWAAPLDDMIGRVLADDLRQRLPVGGSTRAG